MSQARAAPAALRLDVGCGADGPRPGFTGVDVRKLPGVTYVCNAWEIEQYLPPESVEEIRARHFLEHLTFPQADLTLTCWRRLLNPGGVVQVIVPDIRYHIGQFLEPDANARSAANPAWSAFEHAIAGFWGWQREAAAELWDVHKSGYDFALLRASLQRHGFRDVERLRDHPWNLNVRCRK